MQSEKLGIAGALLLSPPTFKDSRGSFSQSFQHSDVLETLGLDFKPVQVNTSISGKGVLRGIHYAESVPGQAKYLSVAHGSILDFIVDLRVDSPTFEKWVSVNIHAEMNKALFIDSGLGHAFVSLKENTVVTYLVDQEFNPSKEHSINPFDPRLNLEFPIDKNGLILSEKDLQAPLLEEQISRGNLTDFSASRFYELNKLGDQS